MARAPKTDDEKRQLVGAFVLPQVRKIISDEAGKGSVSKVAARYLESHPEILKRLKRLKSTA